MTSRYLLPEKEFNKLAGALGERPDRVIYVARLLEKRCRAYVLGDPADFEAAIVQEDLAPEEPAGYGNDADALWELLQTVPGWTCINVSADLSEDLGQLIQMSEARGSDEDVAEKIRYYGDVYYRLSKPLRIVPEHSADAVVRYLTPDDRPLLANAPEELRNGIGDLSGLITDRPCAAALADETIVALAQVYAESRKYADIGVFTMESWRGRGLASATAATLIQRAQAARKIPVWSTGEDNHASMRIAEKLGFTEEGRRCYVIPL